jgi:NNP family nitrate/nitrite transporter-like MFS transporter
MHRERQILARGLRLLAWAQWRALLLFAAAGVSPACSRRRDTRGHQFRPAHLDWSPPLSSLQSSPTSFFKSGHWPTLLASFPYFDFCFAVWVLNGAMAPFISESFHLDAAQKGFMISVPILAGALMRFPLGVLSQYIGRKNAAMVEMSLIILALGFGYFYVDSYSSVLAMGVLLGIAGASFGVALSLGSRWYPPHLKGLAMGVAGAGNSGTVLAVLFAPPLAMKYGWSTVYGLAACTMLLPMLVMWFAAKEPPDRDHQTLREHVACLFEKDGWVFSFIYIVTFGGFIGLASFLPTYFTTSSRSPRSRPAS